MSDSPDVVISPSKAAARIRAAAVDAFASAGYGGTTTRDIAARLDMSPAAMYPALPLERRAAFRDQLRRSHRSVEGGRGRRQTG